MRKIFYLLIFVLPLASCANRSTEADKLAGEKDSLARIVAEKDSVINDVFASMNAVAENLNAIKKRENIINASLDNGEVPKQTATKINEDIEAINQLLIENRQTINRLKQSAEQLRKANIKIANLEKLIGELSMQVDSKNQEIVVLRKELENKNMQVAELSETVTDLNTQVSGLSEEKASLEGEVKTQTNILNTGYYIIGPEKELLAKEIVYKSGFIGRTLKINENRSLDSFTQVDIRQFDEVKIGHKKAVLVSSHPAGSYEFVMGDKGEFEALAIKDKAKFWEYSKVLVISYKP